MSKKNVSLIEKGAGYFQGLVTGMMDIVREQKVPFEAIYRLATPEARVTLGKIVAIAHEDWRAEQPASPTHVPPGFAVFVNRTLSLVQMIEVGGYDNHNEAVGMINELRFPVNRSCVLQYAKGLFLVPPSKDGMTTTEWKAELEANGWALEEAPELFALGAKYSDLQRENYIIAFGSSWRPPDGDLGSPGLWSDDGQRGAGMGWYGPDARWGLHDRALVSRKRR